MSESANVPSPCISVCSISPRSGYCLGCYRTLEEIRDWLLTDNSGRREIIDDLPRRREHEEALREAAKSRRLA